MPRRRISLAPRLQPNPEAAQVPIEVPKSLQKKAKPVKDMDTIIAQAKAMSEKYAGQYDCVTDKDVLIDYVDTIISEKRTGLDTETTGLNIFKDPVVGFSLYVPGRKAIYVPMLHLSRFTGKVDPNQLPVEFCAQQLNRLNGVPGMTIDYFNAPFDMNELWYSMGVKLWDICSNDASLMMRLLNTERHRNNNLKDLHAEFCSHTTRGPRFGELFPPGTFNRCPFKYTSAYGARDAEMASELVDYAYGELRKPENAGLLRVWETIERPLIPVLLRMREKGVLVDEAKRAELIVKYRGLKEAAEADVVHEYEPYIPKINQWRMRFGRTKGKIIDMPVKIGSDGQLKILLYDIMGLPRPESGKVDKHALKEINHPIAGAILRYREATKMLSTYLEGLDKFLHADGTVHGGIKQIGADTGRTSACIAEGTLIECPGVSKPIEQIKPGDMVYTYDDEGTLCLRPVTAVYDNGVKECITLNWQSSGTNECGTLTCTPDHMIKTKYDGWVMADHLKPRQKVFHLRARETAVERVLSGTNNLYWAEHHWLKFHYFDCTDSALHIHHKNGNHKDNRLENLEMLDAHDHLILHGKLLKNEPCYRGVGKYLGKMTEEQKQKYRATRKKHDEQYLAEHGYMYQGLPYTREEWLVIMDKADWRITAVPHDYNSVLLNLRLHRINYIDEFRKRAQVKKLPRKFVQLQPNHLRYALELAEGNDVIAAGYFGVPVDKFRQACKRHNVAYNHQILSIEPAGLRHVYDLEVMDTHAYIAGEVCVHNCDPNMQNIPSHNREIRTMYIARPGRYLISCDYSGQEPRLTASLSKDPKMIETYQKGLDLYSMIAAVAFNTTYEECLEKRPNGELYLEGKERRGQAKTIVLGICYGRQIPSIAEQLKCSVEEAQLIYDKVTKSFPGLLRAQDESAKMAHDKGYVETLWGRRRHLSVMMHDPYEFRYKDGCNPDFDPFDPDGSSDSSELSESVKKKYLNELMSLKWRKDKNEYIQGLIAQGIEVKDYSYQIAEQSRKCLNARIQGSAADMSKLAMIEIDKDPRLKKLDCYLLLMIHDEVICECPIENHKEAITYIKEDMEKVASHLPVPFKSDPETAPCWYGAEVDVEEEDEEDDENGEEV